MTNLRVRGELIAENYQDKYYVAEIELPITEEDMRKAITHKLRAEFIRTGVNAERVGDELFKELMKLLTGEPTANHLLKSTKLVDEGEKEGNDKPREAQKDMYAEDYKQLILEKIGQIIDIQINNPSSKTDSYMRGMANGMIVIESVVTGGKCREMSCGEPKVCKHEKCPYEQKPLCVHEFIIEPKIPTDHGQTSYFRDNTIKWRCRKCLEVRYTMD